MDILPKATYKFNAILFKDLHLILTEIIHYYSFGIEKALDSTAILSKRNNVGGIIIQDEEIILQRRNNRTMALPQE